MAYLLVVGAKCLLQQDFNTELSKCATVQNVLGILVMRGARAYPALPPLYACGTVKLTTCLADMDLPLCRIIEPVIIGCWSSRIHAKS